MPALFADRVQRGVSSFLSAWRPLPFRRALKRRPFFVRRRIHRCVEGDDNVYKKCLVWYHFGF